LGEEMAIGLIVLGLLVAMGLGAFALQSLRERELHAVRIAIGLALSALLLFVAAAQLPYTVQMLIWGLLLLIGIAAGVALLLPIGRVARGADTPTGRVDERDIMFARARLEPGSAAYEAYYRMRPEHQAGDDKTRSLPGLLSPNAKEANPLIFAATDAAFGVTEALRDAVDGPVAAERVELDPALITGYLKDLARYLGARSVGIAALQAYHIYSHIGRGSGPYGAPVSLDHPYAIAFTVEMDHAIMGAAPGAPVVMESARQYVEAAKIAIPLGNLIRSLGYAARAHIDGNYRVIAPLVARDAGLGEIGRMGLLMTPMLGPRVRLGVVTTALPLIPDGRDEDTSVLDFCRICEKCADVCPVQAIPRGDRTEIDGALRWRLNADICFRYWNVIGTDCGRCMALCPYSYPDHWLHNGMRWAVRRSGVARRVALRLDRFFYGVQPPPKQPPSWLPSPPPKAGQSSKRPPGDG
jgi:ferredoxin